MLRTPTIRRRFNALVGLELRRAKNHFLYASSLGGITWFVLWIAGKDSSLVVGTVLLGASGIIAMAVPVHQFKDKLDGGMEFLNTLPAHGATLAAARLATTALCALPSGLAAACLTGWIVTPTLGLDEGLQWPLAAFVGTWAMTTGVNCLLTGLVARLDVDAAAKTGTAVVVLCAVLSKLADRWIGNPIPSLIGFLTVNADTVVYRVAAFALSVAATLVVVGFLLVYRGYNHYRPELNSMNAVLRRKSVAHQWYEKYRSRERLSPKLPPTKSEP